MNQNNSREEYNMPSIEHGGEQWIRMVDHIALTHQELQKAREEWLREEIVKLEGMYKKELEISFEEAHENYIHNQALQTIADRYLSELDQLNK
jgi:hypothetical protein